MAHYSHAAGLGSPSSMPVRAGQQAAVAASAADSPTGLAPRMARPSRAQHRQARACRSLAVLGSATGACAPAADTTGAVRPLRQHVAAIAIAAGTGSSSSSLLMMPRRGRGRQLARRLGSAPANGPSGPLSSSGGSGNNSGDTTGEAGAAAGQGGSSTNSGGGSSSRQRSASPLSTAARGSSSRPRPLPLQVPGSPDEDIALQQLHAAPPVPASDAVREAASSPTASSAAAAAMAAAAAAAEAAVAGAVDDMQSGSGLLGGGAAAAAASDVQDTFTLLKLQLASGAGPQALSTSLMPLVRHAAAEQLPIAAVMTGERQPLLLALMEADDTSVAVLATEAWCRVCGEPELERWADWLLPAVPVLLRLVDANALPDARRTPLLFFAISALVRMSSVPAVAAAVGRQGGAVLLVRALNVAPAAVCQVATFALFRLLRELDGDMTDSQLAAWQPAAAAAQPQQLQDVGKLLSGAAGAEQEQQQQQLVLLDYVHAGAFGKLCEVLMQVSQGSAHELAFSMLLSIALVPAAQQAVADRGEVAHVVQLLLAPPSPAVRLEAMLVLGRLAARSTACQQDAVREGAVPALVRLMGRGTAEEKCHASRLLAILGQHETTHQSILQAGALPIVLQLLRDRGYPPSPSASVQPFFSDSGALSAAAQTLEQLWQETLNDSTGDGSGSFAAPAVAAVPAAPAPATAAAASPPPAAMDAGGLEAAADSKEEEENDDEEELAYAEDDDEDDSLMTSGPFRAPPQAHHHAARAHSSSSSSSSDGGSGSGEGSGSTAGVSPELVLEQAVGLACMLANNVDNHFTLVNEGLVPLLVPLLHGAMPKTQTYSLAAILILSMADSRNAAVVARAGAIPALVSIAREAGNRPGNRELSAAVLAVLCRSQVLQVEVVASGGIPALTRLLVEGTPGARCSAAEALTHIATTSAVRCRLVVRAGALPPLAAMLQPGSSSSNLLWAARLLKALVQQEGEVLWEVCEAPGLLSAIPGVLTRRPGQQQLQRLILEFRQSRAGGASAALAAAAVAVAGMADAAESDGSSPADWSAAAAGGGDDDSSSGPDGEDDSLSASEDLAKAQAHLAWLLAALTSHPKTRHIMSELASFLVRPLVALLRDAQRGSSGLGPGYSLQDVLSGLSNNRQAGASAALRALMASSPENAQLVHAELLLQVWAYGSDAVKLL